MIGKTISHYKIVEKLGEGGMGVVYRAQDTKLDRTVALKFLPPELIRDSEAKTRFIHEAKAAAALSHPNICTVHEIDEREEQIFIATECIEGETLKEKIASGPMKIDEALSVVTQVAEGLQEAHEKGIVHRDIKSANIMVTPKGQAKIMDFGLAKLAGGTNLTKTGTTVGTIAYMSPEQARGEAVDHRSDLWSFGVVVFEMVSGQLPFKGDHEQAVMYSIVNEEPKPLTGLRTGVPEELKRIVSKCLTKDPGERYPKATDLLANLRHLQRIITTQAPLIRSASSQTGVGRLVRHWPWMAVFALAAVLTVMVLRRTAERDTAPAVKTSDVHVDERAGQVSSSGPSIAVLPFTNAGGDPDQELFSDGLTVDIITELSRFRELAVFARNSTAHYKGRDIDIREIGALLGARYVLQGSVRKAGERIRVSVQLYESGNGRSVWGTNYERDLTVRDLFELQDELTQQVVNAIAGSYGALTRAELPDARRKPPASLDSYDCVLRAYEYLHVHTAENHLAARDCLEGVVGADPDYAEGRAWLAYLYADQYHHRWNERTDEYDALDRALQVAEEAVRLDPVSQVAHGALALTCFLRGDPERGKIEAYRTIDLNPNNALWLALLGNYLSAQGDFERSVPMVRKVVALNPHPPPWIRNAIFLDHYVHGRYEAALAEANRMELGDFRNPLFLAAAYGQLDRPDDARRALQELRALWPRPDGDIRRELIERHAFSAALTDHLMEGLAKAGLKGVANPTASGSTLVD
jgi:serine/threonine protein kinase/tetratricopeptide (TPR) repeat protein